ncbi:Flagellar biosynthetic protein flhB [Providencia alcalifaciens]|nr:Flagellar biosynthetic protein flhB [Providencia alcalifaciens]
MSDESDVEKTEEPTPHKKQKAKDDGQIVRSKELSSLMMMLAGVSLLWLSGGHLATQLRQIMRQGFIFDGHYLQNTGLMLSYLGRVVSEALFALLPIIGGLALVGISASSLVGGLLFNSKLIKFDLKKLNPIKGLKRIFSMNALSELFKAILKCVFVGLGASIFFMAKLAIVTALGDGASDYSTSKCVRESDFCRVFNCLSVNSHGGI